MAMTPHQRGQQDFSPDRQHHSVANARPIPLFYRRRLHGIGQARVWAGVTGDGDGILGGDGTSVLTTHWALSNQFQHDVSQQTQRPDTSSWGLALNMVWYPGYVNPRSGLNPYKALFDVADNTLLLIKQTGK